MASFNNSFDLNTFINIFSSATVHDKIMSLSIYVDGDDDLKNKYMNAAIAHNNKLIQDPHFYDAGFDIFLSKNTNQNEANLYGEGKIFLCDEPINKVNFNIKCCAKMYHINSSVLNNNINNNLNNVSFFSPFYTYMRSSMSKTPLRLANNQGIIDAGYRGPLIGMFDCLYKHSDQSGKGYDYYVEPYTRMLQICAPGLVPIYVQIVDSVDELGPSTSRGEGGLGSTGI